MKPDKKWDQAVNRLTGVHCGRLDMSTYDCEGNPGRYVYADQFPDRILVTGGGHCDEVAYMAAMYPVMRDRVNELEAECERLKNSMKERRQ